jgi:GntR family transcriptional regulator/MocR family aminotransferase
VSVTTSATAGVQRTCHALLARGVTSVAVEDPGWTALHDVVRRCGLAVVPVPVDGEGLRSTRSEGANARCGPCS